MLVLLDHRARLFDRVGDHALQVQPRHVERDQALGDARYVEQVVEQVVHVARLAVDDGAGLDGQRLVGAAHRQDLGGGADRGERVAQFVRQHRQEFVLVAAGLLQRLGGAHPFGDIGYQPDEPVGPARAAIQAAMCADPVVAAIGPDDSGVETQWPGSRGGRFQG